MLLLCKLTSTSWPFNWKVLEELAQVHHCVCCTFFVVMSVKLIIKTYPRVYQFINWVKSPWELEFCLLFKTTLITKDMQYSSWCLSTWLELLSNSIYKIWLGVGWIWSFKSTTTHHIKYRLTMNTAVPSCIVVIQTWHGCEGILHATVPSTSVL